MKKRNQYLVRGVLVVFLLGLGFSHPVMAENMDAPLKASVPPVTGQSSPETKIERTPDGKYYLDFKAASLINVLNVLSNLSGINFVTGREVADRQVSMTLNNASLDDALQSISLGCNVTYDFLPGKNIYLFRASSDAPEKPALMTRVFKLYYVRVTKMQEIGSSSDSSGSSSSGSTGSSGSSGSSSTGLVSLQSDQGTEDLENSAIYKAIEKILSERGKVSVDDRSNSLIVTDSEDRLKMIESAIAQLDRAVDQVLINVLLIETYENLDRNLGIEWGNATTGSFGTVSGGQQATNFPFTKSTDGNFLESAYNVFKDSAQQFDPTRTTGAVTAGNRNFTDFRIQVKALENASKLKILAKPKILALDNQPALIKISTQTAIGTTQAVTGGTSGTTTTTEQAERAETGTILRVTPLINTGGKITLTVEPTFATADASAISVGGNSSLDPTSRTARTTLMVHDGQTIALGGLLFSTQSNGDRKVPFFGNIPVIGKALFTSNDKSVLDRELILFVTPYIITDPSMLESEAPPEKRLRFEDEIAPFWKVKQKQWYKEVKDGPAKDTDFDGYFNVRQKLINSTLNTLDQGAQAPASGAK
jgi:type IV pilus assembly protein PilQ